MGKSVTKDYVLKGLQSVIQYEKSAEEVERQLQEVTRKMEHIRTDLEKSRKNMAEVMNGNSHLFVEDPNGIVYSVAKKNNNSVSIEAIQIVKNK